MRRVYRVVHDSDLAKAGDVLVVNDTGAHLYRRLDYITSDILIQESLEITQFSPRSRPGRPELRLVRGG